MNTHFHFPVHASNHLQQGNSIPASSDYLKYLAGLANIGKKFLKKPNVFTVFGNGITCLLVLNWKNFEDGAIFYTSRRYGDLPYIDSSPLLISIPKRPFNGAKRSRW